MPSASRARPLGGLIAIGVFVAVVALYPVIVTTPYFLYVGVLTVMNMALATSWNLMGGFTGYVSLGHSAFFGVGAYLTGLAVADLGWSSLPAVVASGIAVAVIALGIGYVALRVRGASFVIVTIALVYISSLIAQGWRSVTGGSSGLTVPPALPGATRGELHQLYFWAFLALLALVLSLWWFLDHSKFGLGLKAIREDEDKAESLGVATTAFKVVTFGLSAGFVAMGGALYGQWFGFLDPIFVFSILIAANMVLMSLLGGIRSLWGPVLGAALIVPSTEYFLVRFGASQWHLVVTGVVLALVVLVMPDGVIPAVRSLWRRRQPPAASIREHDASAAPLAPQRSEVPS